MRFTSIDINNFRNISSAVVDTDGRDVVLKGTNGQGKTNFLEAVYMLSYASSFRTAHLSEVLMHGKDYFYLSGRYEDDYGEKGEVVVSFKDGKRTINLDGNQIRDRKELIYRFPSIVFSHEDMTILKGEPSDRRRFFDQTISLYSPMFLDDLRMYRNILEKRNASIKSGSYELLDIYDEKLASLGFEIMNMRKKEIDDFNGYFPDLFSKVSGTDEKLEVVYSPSWKDVDSVDGIIEILSSTRERDVKMQTTTSGIHRDRFNVVGKNGLFSQYASTGQIRLCSLLFRLSEVKAFSKASGRKPIVLVDDVLLELDDVKRGRFLSVLDDYSQAFYTFLPHEGYFSSEHAKPITYRVEDGRYEVE